MRLVRNTDLRPGPWKNGGGETREIAALPPGAGMDGFDWRLSMATVAADGPFSVFPGIDRVLFLLSGDGMVLDIGGAAHHLHTGDRIDFAAETPVTGRLSGGPVRDLNIMVRRDRLSVRVDRLRLRQGAVLPLPDPAGALFVLSGMLVADPGGLALQAQAWDTLILDPGHAGTIRLSGEADLLRIGFTPR
ncbi:HutD family protein [Aliigemmobacter aestuarii]|uniref:HutD family protein n=1 Tax=Aliigemmobacter aestuarii TaxID=1445661 RepID=A0A4V3V018_9RHOB|nr:HutD family protein [Gemmobacter aestuarii]THD81351.1 HutD family protein [Gemmobacter aestuarii]